MSRLRLAVVCVAVAAGYPGRADDDRPAGERLAIRVVAILDGKVEYDEAAAGRPVVGVVLRSAAVDDRTVRGITGLTRLRRLVAPNSGLTDAGVRAVAGLATLEELDLTNAAITDAAVPALAELKRLKTLDLTGTRITAAGADKLRAALPAAKITHAPAVPQPAAGKAGSVRLEGVRGTVLAMAFSPDGKRLAAAGGMFDHITGKTPFGLLLVWEVGTPRPLYVKEFAEIQSAVAFSPDGKTLVTGCEGFKEPAAVRLWDADTGKERAAIPKLFCRTLAIAPDGKSLAVGNGMSARVYDLNTLELKSTTGAHQYPITRVRYAPDGKTLLTASTDTTVALWNPADGSKLATLKHAGRALDLDFTPDGKTLAVAGGKDITLWAMPAGTEIGKLTGHAEDVDVLLFTDRGLGLTSISRKENNTRKWDVGTRGQRLSVAVAPAQMLYHPAGGLATYYQGDGDVRVSPPPGR